MKFCFFGDISGAIKGKTIGGGELQTFLLAKALALKGHEVVIIDPYAEQNLITPEGIKLITVPNWNKGLKGIRLFQYRIPSLHKIFESQKADYYYVRMRSYLHLIPYLVAKRNGGLFVHAIASDSDLLSAWKKFKYLYKSDFNMITYLTESIPNDLVFNFLLQKSDFVTVQHSGQVVSPSVSKSRQILFPNLIDLSNLPSNKNPSKSYFIYVGSLTMLKGADKLLQLLNTLDSSIQVMIIGSPKGAKSKKIYEQLKEKTNVLLKGRMSHKDTLYSISNAKAIINTSYYEGFPNIYLEAWGMGIPVISLIVNPGGIFNKYSLGICCDGDLNRMKSCIESNEIDSISGDDFKKYVTKFHAFQNAADRFLSMVMRKTF